MYSVHCLCVQCVQGFCVQCLCVQCVQRAPTSVWWFSKMAARSVGTHTAVPCTCKHTQFSVCEEHSTTCTPLIVYNSLCGFLMTYPIQIQNGRYPKLINAFDGRENISMMTIRWLIESRKRSLLCMWIVDQCNIGN